VKRFESEKPITKREKHYSTLDEREEQRRNVVLHSCLSCVVFLSSPAACSPPSFSLISLAYDVRKTRLSWRRLRRRRPRIPGLSAMSKATKKREKEREKKALSEKWSSSEEEYEWRWDDDGNGGSGVDLLATTEKEGHRSRNECQRKRKSFSRVKMLSFLLIKSNHFFNEALLYAFL